MLKKLFSRCSVCNNRLAVTLLSYEGCCTVGKIRRRHEKIRL